MRVRTCTATIVVLVGVTACCKPDTALPGHPATGGIDLAGMDRSTSPGDDFFKFANGSWLATTEIPADRASFGTGAVLQELTAKRTADLIQDAAAHAEPDSDARKIGDYYASFMDEAAIEQAGLAPLAPRLAAIAAIADLAGLSRYLGTTLRADVDVLNNTAYDTDNLLGLWVAQDLDDPTRYAAFLLQGGLGLPDRDYYLDAAPRMAEIRGKYEAHVAAMLALAKVSDAPAKATAIVELEKRIATVHAPRVDTEDVHKGDNHVARAALPPGLDWAAFLDAAGLGTQATFVAWQPAAISAISALVRDVDLATWKAYLTWHALHRAAFVLPKAFVDADFAFYGTTLSGTPALRDRWKRAIDATDHALGESVGKLYVAKYFPPSEKARVEGMVKRELAAFANRIDHLAWMAPATKLKAKAKLAALKVGVGYPDRWRDYRSLKVVRGDALGNWDRAEQFELARNVRKLGRPVDRGEWVMNPQLVNAVNLPAMNALNFPAAILQPPYLDSTRPIVDDYAATGATIGHEISHSFDNTGALFDATGKLENWWTPEDFAHFDASTAALAAQYDGYAPFPDLHVNGKLTVGENIADVAGLLVAYDAYRAEYGGKEAPAAQGFTGDQQFFLAFAQSWRTKHREGQLRQRILTDGHAPAEFRGDTVRNLDAWYPAFSISAGKLYLAPEARVHVW